MRTSYISLAALYSVALASPLSQPSSPALESNKLTAQARANVDALLAKGEPSPALDPECTSDNVAERKEWSSLTSAERTEYIEAVHCLSRLPPKTPASIASGARNRYDDFVSEHIQQTLSIHNTGNFLTWHRHYVWAYEQVLRNECGYTGYQPYYNWALSADDPKKSLALGGGPESMSGDGVFIANRSRVCIPSQDACLIALPPAEGGGCVESGPFVNWTANLGPVAPVYPDIAPNPEMSGLGFNPRCLRRDISTDASAYTSDSAITSLITSSPDFATFTTVMQGDFSSPSSASLGVHGGGHFTIGGDPGGDFFSSSADPFFFLHHAMIDRTWWTWQNLNITERQFQLFGTITMFDQPPSRNATLEDAITMGYVGVKDTTIGGATSSVVGPYCYVYT